MPHGNRIFDKKEAVVLGLLLVAHFDTLSDSKFEILVIMLVVGVGSCESS
jgi:hypothetical protein